MQINHPQEKKNIARWQWVLFALLQFFNLYQIITHAMWRDELQTWSIVRESSSLAVLFHNMLYEGFPPLWYLIQWELSFISMSPLTMQLFHFICSFAVQFLIMSRAPFPGNMRLAIVAGYYISFEYCIISRAYVLGVLLIFLFCAFKEWSAEHPLLRGGLLGLLANTSVYGAILSLVFAADDLWENFRRRKDRRDNRRHYLVEIFGFMLIYGMLFFVAAMFMIPPDDGMFATGWNLHPEFTELIFDFLRNILFLVPIPTPKVAFWNSLAVIDAGMWLSVPVSLLIMLAIWFALRSAPRFLLLFLTGFIGIWLFTVVKYLGYLRHIGAVMILFLACIWLMSDANKEKKSHLSRGSLIAIWCILVVNLFAWAMASYYHLRYEFSGSREMARFIQGSGMNSYPIVSDIDYATSSVAGYLGRPLYYATNSKARTFIRWNKDRKDCGDPVGALALANDLAIRNNSPVLLLMNYPLESENALFLTRTGDSIVVDEMFYLYEYVRH